MGGPSGGNNGGGGSPNQMAKDKAARDKKAREAREQDRQRRNEQVEKAAADRAKEKASKEKEREKAKIKFTPKDDYRDTQKVIVPKKKPVVPKIVAPKPDVEEIKKPEEKKKTPIIVKEDNDNNPPVKKVVTPPKAIAPKPKEIVKVAKTEPKEAVPYEMSADEIRLRNRRKGRKTTVLTSVTGVEGKPTLSRRTLLG